MAATLIVCRRAAAAPTAKISAKRSSILRGMVRGRRCQGSRPRYAVELARQQEIVEQTDHQAQQQPAHDVGVPGEAKGDHQRQVRRRRERPTGDNQRS